MIAFSAAGVLGLCMPSVLGSGGDLIVALTDKEMVLKVAIITFLVKFCFGSQFRIRRSWRNFFSASDIRRNGRRNLLYDRNGNLRFRSDVYE